LILLNFIYNKEFIQKKKKKIQLHMQKVDMDS
jgi:hypothetical protein